jgi:hypothetical protein
MTITSPAITSQVRHDDEKLEPYRFPYHRLLPDLPPVPVVRHLI